MKVINMYAYQMDFYKLEKNEGVADSLKSYWNWNQVRNTLIGFNQFNLIQKKKDHPQWFMVLDTFHEYVGPHLVKQYGGNGELPDEITSVLSNEIVGEVGKHNYIIGRFIYAEIGYKAEYMHSQTMEKRDNDKDLQEGELKYVYFYLRASDGLFLLQGDMKITQSKVNDYFEDKFKNFMEPQGIHSVSINTLLREDFISIIEKIDHVNQIEIEFAVEKIMSDDNEVIRFAKQQQTQYEANYMTLIWHAKYKQKSLSGFSRLLEDFKPRGSVNAIKGVRNIKVRGRHDGEFKQVFLKKLTERYTISAAVNEFNVILPNELRIQLLNLGVERERLYDVE